MRWFEADSPDYPAALAPLAGRPERLCVEGKLPPDRPALAIVGTRQPTEYGRRIARDLGRQAARAGWVVVSGLAYGIDTAAHEGCLEGGGTTWAVLGNGLPRVYPSPNAALARRIVEKGGCLISELPENVGPLKHHFLARNRIVAGLALATIVVEGRDGSGSLNTAWHALQAGREVYAVPGPIDEPESEAPFILLKEGAAPLRRIADAFAALEPYLPPAASSNRNDVPPAGAAPVPLSLVERKILQCLGSHTRTLEQLGQAAALDIVRLSTILLDMELNDLVQSLPGQRYAQKRNH